MAVDRPNSGNCWEHRAVVLLLLQDIISEDMKVGIKSLSANWSSGTRVVLGVTEIKRPL